MKKIYAIGFVALALVGCNNRSMLLSRTGFSVEKEVSNHSSIYIEKDQETGQAVLNQANRVANTNYIFAIERELSLGQVAPLVDKVKQHKYSEGNMHSDSLKVYYSYADTLHNNMGFVDFQQVEFGYEGPSALKNLVYIGEKGILLEGNEVQDLAQLKELIQDRTDLQLGFSQDLAVEKYIQMRVFLHEFDLLDKFSNLDMVY